MAQFLARKKDSSKTFRSAVGPTQPHIIGTGQAFPMGAAGWE
jgi:hypothetical protein